MPERTRYSARMLPVGRGFPALNHSQVPIASPPASSYKGVGCTATYTGSMPCGKAIPQGKCVGLP